MTTDRDRTVMQALCDLFRASMRESGICSLTRAPSSGSAR